MGVVDPAAGVLEFVACFEAVVAAQVARALDCGELQAKAELDALVDAGLLQRVRVADDLAPVLRLSDAGQRTVKGSLPALEPLALPRVRHWIGATWLWLAGQEGVFCVPRLVVSRRGMMAAERSGEMARLFPEGGVRGFGRVLSLGGGPVYPDVMLVRDAAGSPQVAVHLELASDPDAVFWRRLMFSYQNDPRIQAVLVFVQSPHAKAALRDVAATVAEDAAQRKFRVRRIAGGEIGFGER